MACSGEHGGASPDSKSHATVFIMSYFLGWACAPSPNVEENRGITKCITLKIYFSHITLSNKADFSLK